MPASLSEEERRRLGIKKRLPLNLQEAREYLRADKELTQFFGKVFIDKYLAINEVCVLRLSLFLAHARR